MPLGFASRCASRRSMWRTRLDAAVFAAMAGLAGCGSDDAATPALDIDAMEAPPDAGAGAESPADNSTAASSGELIAEDAAEAGESDASAEGAASADSGTPDGPSALTLCLRLQDPRRPAGTVQLSLMVQQAYVRLVYLDCDVAAMIAQDEDTLSEFQNALVAWNLHFWGCDDQPPTDLGILRAGFDGVTSADIARLIDHYIASANQVLVMSAGEEGSMRAALASLGALAAPRASNEFSLSTCTADAGAASDDAAAGDHDGGAP
jgi:hypothetical protein